MKGSKALAMTADILERDKLGTFCCETHVALDGAAGGPLAGLSLAPRMCSTSPATFQTFRTLQGAEIWANHGEWVTHTKPDFGPGIRERFQWAATVGEGEVAKAKKRREMFAERVHNMLSNGSVLALPTAPGIAPKRGASGAELDDFRARALCLLSTAGLAGLPQISLRLASLEGCPLGLSLVGRRGSDMELLTLAEDMAAET